MKDNLKNMLIEGANAFSIAVDDSMIASFDKFGRLLLEWNAKMNLTAISEEEDIVLKHFIDSLSIAPYIPDDAKTFIDIGTGAGFPSIPLKITKSGLDITMVDSLNKRVLFLKEAIRTLNMDNIQAVHGRAEDLGQDKYFREQFDVCTARAVAALNILLEYCLPFVKVGGTFIAMKGSSTDEIKEAKKALNILGGSVEDIHEITLPFSDIKRTIIIVRKFRQTPTNYPRKAGKPSKQPLI